MAVPERTDGRSLDHARRTVCSIILTEAREGHPSPARLLMGGREEKETSRHPTVGALISRREIFQILGLICCCI